MIYSPETTAAIFKAISAVEMGNNGYADIGNNEEVARALEIAGYVVIKTTDLHGKPVFQGFTKKAQKALRTEPFAVSTYKTVSLTINESFDLEGRILSRNDDYLN